MFQERIRQLRLEHDMSQEDLAQIMDVTRQSISKYENGTAEPSYDKLAMLVEHFNVSYDDLLAENVTDPEQKVTRRVSKESSVKKPKLPDVPVIEVISVLNPEEDELFIDFKVVEKPAYQGLENRPVAVLMGVQPRTGSFFKPRDIQLAWYATLEDAERECNAALSALESGRKMYHLEHYVPVKRHGLFGVQIDEEAITE